MNKMWVAYCLVLKNKLKSNLLSLFRYRCAVEKFKINSDCDLLRANVLIAQVRTVQYSIVQYVRCSPFQIPPTSSFSFLFILRFHFFFCSCHHPHHYLTTTSFSSLHLFSPLPLSHLYIFSHHYLFLISTSFPSLLSVSPILRIGYSALLTEFHSLLL